VKRLKKTSPVPRPPGKNLELVSPAGRKKETGNAFHAEREVLWYHIGSWRKGEDEPTAKCQSGLRKRAREAHLFRNLGERIPRKGGGPESLATSPGGEEKKKRYSSSGFCLSRG